MFRHSTLGLIEAAPITRPGSKAIQTIYTAGVPHTDKNGRPLVQFKPDQSFLQLAIWGKAFEDRFEPFEVHVYRLKP